MSAGTTESTTFNVTLPNADEVSQGMIIAERYVDSNYRTRESDETLVCDRDTESCETFVLYFGPFAFVAYASGENKDKQPSAELWSEILDRIRKEYGMTVIPFPDGRTESLVRIVGVWRQRKSVLLWVAVAILIVASALAFRFS